MMEEPYNPDADTTETWLVNCKQLFHNLKLEVNQNENIQNATCIETIHFLKGHRD